MNATFETPKPIMKSRNMKRAKRKILLVNDVPATSQMLSRLLAEDDFLVLTAANGGEALELANITKFDLDNTGFESTGRGGVGNIWTAFSPKSAVAGHHDHQPSQSVFSRGGFGHRRLAGKTTQFHKAFSNHP